MVLLYLLLLLGTCAISFSSDANFKSNYQTAPRYTINLDLPPQKRWESVLNNFNHTIVQQVADKLIAQLSGYKYELIQRLSKKYIDHLIHPYVSEMQGIAKLINGSFADVVMLNIYFDAYLRGTSIIAKDANGDILHGRNLDVPFASWLRKMVIVVDYKRNKKIVYTGTTFVGYVGLWTGQKPYKFTISANSRDYGDWFDHGLYFCEDGYPDGWLIRDVLEKADHFLTAYLKLMLSPVLHSIYITVAGIKQGVIIVKERVTSLQSYYFEPDKWFLLQTDCDKYENECQNDAGRVAIVNAMNHDKKKNISANKLFKVFASINETDINTAHTTIMCAASPGIYATWIRKN